MFYFEVKVYCVGPILFRIIVNYFILLIEQIGVFLFAKRSFEFRRSVSPVVVFNVLLVRRDVKVLV